MSLLPLLQVELGGAVQPEAPDHTHPYKPPPEGSVHVETSKAGQVAVARVDTTHCPVQLHPVGCPMGADASGIFSWISASAIPRRGSGSCAPVVLGFAGEPARSPKPGEP
jgi:hypothetical protein